MNEEIEKFIQGFGWRSNKKPGNISGNRFAFMSCPECENFELVIHGQIDEWKCSTCLLNESQD